MNEKLEYAIDILKDELNELIEFQSWPKHAIKKELFEKRRESLELGIKTLKEK